MLLGTSTEEEVLQAFSDFMNSKVGADAQLQYLLPISSPQELFGSVADGVLLSKMINVAAPDTIDERVLNLGARNPFRGRRHGRRRGRRRRARRGVRT